MALKDLTYYIYNTPFGQVTIGSNGDAVTALSLEACQFSGCLKPNEVTNACSTQILEFLSGRRVNFDIPIVLSGTEFQIKVWQALQKIPYGEICSPSQLAKMIGNESSYRKVPIAAHANKIAILIPNHRLVPTSRFEKPSREERIRLALRNIEKKYTKE